MYIGTIVFLLAVALLYRRRMGTLANPPTLFCLSLAAALVSISVIQWLEPEALTFCVECPGAGGRIRHLEDLAGVYLLGAICFLPPWILVGHPKPQPTGILRDQSYLPQLFSVVEVLLLVAIAFACMFLGTVPMLSLLNGASNFDLEDLLPQIPLGLMSIIALLTMTHALLLSTLIANPRSYKLGLRRLALSIPLAVIAGTWNGRRQFLFVYLFCILVRRHLKPRKVSGLFASLRRAVLVGTVGLVAATVFVGVEVLRLTNGGWSSGGGAVYRPVEYEAFAPINLLSATGYFEDEVHSMTPVITLRWIIPDRLINKEDLERLDRIAANRNSPGGYSYEAYIDFGYLGVIVLSFLFGWIAKLAYRDSLHCEAGMRCYLLLMFACAFASVYPSLLEVYLFLIPLVAQALGPKVFGLRWYGPGTSRTSTPPSGSPLDRPFRAPVLGRAV